MKKTLVVIVVLLLGIGGAALPAASLSPTSAEEAVVTLDEMDDGTPVDLRGDQTLVIDLEGNLSTGYQWQVAAVDDAILKQVGQFEFKQYADVAGSAGRQILRFRAVGEGQTDLTLAYRRPWEDAAPLRDYDVQVRATGPFEPYEDDDTAAEPPARDLGPISTPALPTSFEWCGRGGCTPVKDQGACGSCWAFATSGVVESLIKLSDGETRDLAEQYLVSCNTNGWGCPGGDRAFDYFINRFTPAELAAGAVYEPDYPYTSGATGSTGTCTGSPHDKHETLVSWGLVGGGIQYPTVAQIKQAIYEYGPVYVSMCASTAFSGYSGGVFSTDESGACTTGTNHGVVLVGWDDSQGTSGVWYLRNSWGSWWGEELNGAGGYMRIEYGTSNVGRRPAYATYKYDILERDVAITKTVVGSEFAPGDPITFTLHVENNGNVIAAGVVVTDLVPAEVLTPTVDSTLAITPTGAISYVWDVEPLLAGASGTITITGWIDPDLPEDFGFVNQASISDPMDGFPGNNVSLVIVGGSRYYLPMVAHTPSSWVTIASEDFEGTFPSSSWLVFDADPGHGGEYYWGRRTCLSSGGSYSGWSVGAGDTTLSCGSNYPIFTESWMIYGPFSLADASVAELSFDWWSETEVDDDTFFWGASGDGSSFSGYSVSGGWAYWTEGEVLDLGSLAGDDSVWIAFRFDSDGLHSYRGSFVDNIVLRKYVDGAAPSGGGDSAAPLRTPGPGQTIEFTTIRLER